jgi:uncharacterized NAD(P)/FAD-binding protein YdhS
MSEQWANICLIGAGPRGVAVLERLWSNEAASASRGVLTVHVVDPFVTDGGRVWHTGHSATLLMNTVASQVTMYTDDSVSCVGPVVPGPSLYEWAKSLRSMADTARLPANVFAEADRLGPDDYPSRMCYGHYLNWVLRTLIRTAPPTVRIELHRDTAVELRDVWGGSQTVVLAGGTVLAGLDAVVLAQGHVDTDMGADEHALAEFAAVVGAHYEPPGNPAEVDLGFVEPGQPVGLRGMGLNFFDHIALLTIDRGGRFVRRPDGWLDYHPSGREPLLYAGSRRGVPYHARGENQKGAFGRHTPLVFTAEVIADLRASADAGMPAEFHRDVWPLIAKEVEAVYYHTLISARRGPSAADRFLDEFLTDTDGRGPTARLLVRHGVPAELRWDWSAIAQPHRSRHFTSRAEYQEWLLGYLRTDVREARDGNVGSPLKAALDVLRDLRNEVRLTVDHSGLTGRSYREELQNWYTPFNAFLSIGPPVRRIEEMIALIEAGVLRVLAPGMFVRADWGTGEFQLRATSISEPPVRVRRLIEARLPDTDIRRARDPLLRYLLRTGRCQPYRIPNGPATDTYQTGGLAVTQRPYHLLDAESRPHPRRFAFGVPTEAVHWVTAAGIRPGADSVILADADAIARACLGLYPTTVPDPVTRNSANGAVTTAAASLDKAADAQ